MSKPEKHISFVRKECPSCGKPKPHKVYADGRNICLTCEADNRD